MNRLLTGLFLFCLLACSQKKSGIWDHEKLAPFNLQYRMSQSGNPVGTCHISLNKSEPQWVLTEITKVPSMEEEIQSYFHIDDHRMDSVLIGGKASGFPIICQATWINGKIVGQSDFPKHPQNPTVSIDTLINDKIIERTLSFWLLPYYQNLKSGFAKKYQQINTVDGKFYEVSAKHVELTNIEIDGQSYEAHLVQLRGGVASQNVYINVHKPEILKITFDGNDWVYELVKRSTI